MTTPDADLVFTQEEIDLIGRTADAMSAYMGKPVLAEIMDAEDTGAEWVAFGIPLDVNDEVDEDATVVIQLGGPGARYAGNRGGLGAHDDDVYDCDCLWIIQLSEDETGRYVKVDPLNQEYVAGNDLRELLPFDISDDAFDLSPQDDEEEIADDDDDAEETRRMDRLLDDATPPSRRLH